MSLNERSWQLATVDGAIIRRGSPGPAFSRAREILLYPGDLTIEEFEELDEMFREVSQAEFAALTEDPLHQGRLRGYEILSWRRGQPIVLILTVLFVLCGLAGIIMAR